jgi:putative SOS response-associated peptidase YedK
MCGRIRLGVYAKYVAEKLEARLRGDFAPSLNIKPTQAAVVLIGEDGERVVEAMRWGLIPSWATDDKFANKLFNARAETIADKPSFRSAFKSRRCGIVVDAFYEWADVDGKRVPHAFRVVGAELFTLAGLFEEWRSPDGEIVRTCTIVTTETNEQMRAFHHRMPVILEPGALAKWIDPAMTPETLKALLVPFSGQLAIERATL